MIGESELWFDDVERFARRHLTPNQYDQIHAASPADLAEQVERLRGRNGDGPIPQEEFAVAERVVKINSGLKELRQGIGG